MSDTTLNEIFPDEIEFPLRKGKKAILGPFTFSTIKWAIEKYETLNNFYLEIFKGAQRATKGTVDDYFVLITNVAFQILENQDDFKDEDEFIRLIPLDRGHDFVDIVCKIIKQSMLKEESQPKGKTNGKKKRKQRGSQ